MVLYGLSNIQRLSTMALKAAGDEAAAEVRVLIQLANEQGDLTTVKRLSRLLEDAQRRTLVSRPNSITNSNHRLIPSRMATGVDAVERSFVDGPLPTVEQSPLLQPGTKRALLDYLEQTAAGKCENLLFLGPSGTGKTMSACWLAGRLARPLFRLNFPRIFESYLGKTPRNLSSAFREVEDAGGILFLDEMDAVLRSRSIGSDHNEMQRTVNVLLMELDEITGSVPVMAATNLGEQIDPAVSRRFQRILHYELPDAFMREKYIRDNLKFLPPPFAIPAMVQLSEGFSYAHLENALNKLTSIPAAVREFWPSLLHALAQAAPFDKAAAIRNFIAFSSDRQAAGLVAWGVEKQVAASLFGVAEATVTGWLAKRMVAQ